MKIKFYYSDGGKHPVLGQVYHKCQQVIGSHKERYQRYITNTLSMYISGQDDCNRVLSMIDNVEKGVDSQKIIEGNDVELTLSSGGVQIDILVNDDWIDKPEGYFSLDELKAVISGWRSFLSLSESLESSVEIEI